MYDVKDMGGSRKQGTNVNTAQSEHFRYTDRSEFRVHVCLSSSMLYPQFID